MTTRAPGRLGEWIGWLKVLDDEVSTLYLHRAVWQQIATTIDENPAIPRTVALNVLHTMYAAAQAVAVRRVAKGDARSIAFEPLLRGIRKTAPAFTRDWWLGHYPNDLAAAIAGSRDWDRNFAGSTKTYLDPALVDRDLAQIDARVRPINRYVDQWVAHRDRKAPAKVPTFKDLNSAIDCLGGLLQRYTLLLEAADRQPIGPLVIGDVMAPFRVAWLPPLAPRKG